MNYVMGDADKQRLLILTAYELDKQLHRLGRELAEALDTHHQSMYSDDEKDMYERMDLEHFYDNFYYIFAEMEFLEELISLFGPVPDDLVEMIRQEHLKSETGAAEWYVGPNFKWSEMRYYTEQEQAEIAKKGHELVVKWLKENDGEQKS